MPRSSNERPTKDGSHRTSIIVALITAISVVLAAVLPKAFDRPPVETLARPQGTRASAPPATANRPSASIAADSTNFERYAIAVWRTLDTVPPLRRDEIAKALFVGREVEWAGLVSSIAPDRRGFIVGVRRRTGYSALFVAIVDSPQLSVASAMRIDDSVVIRGRISRVAYDLWLDRAIAH